MMHKVSAFVVIILAIAMTTPIAGAQITAPKLSITTIATENLQVVGSNGVRGAAAAVLDDNQLLRC